MNGADPAPFLRLQVVNLQRRRVRETRALRRALIWTWALVGAVCAAGAVPGDPGWPWALVTVLFLVAGWRTSAAVPLWPWRVENGADQ